MTELGWERQRQSSQVRSDTEYAEEWFFFLSLSSSFFIKLFGFMVLVRADYTERSAPSARAAPFIQHKKLFDAGHVSHPPEVNRKQIKSILGLEVNEWIFIFFFILLSFWRVFDSKVLKHVFLISTKKNNHLVRNLFLGIFWIFANIFAFWSEWANTGDTEYKSYKKSLSQLCFFIQKEIVKLGHNLNNSTSEINL